MQVRDGYEFPPYKQSKTQHKIKDVKVLLGYLLKLSKLYDTT